MVRTLPVCAVLLALAPAAHSQKKDKPFEDVIRMTVHPAAAPKPALKYQLLPELREMNPGNPILGYLRCFAEQNNFFFSKQAEDQRERWMAMPLKDLPVKEMRGYGGAALRRADYAARLDTPDWQMLLLLRKEGFATLVPDLQQMRVLTRALQVRFRGEAADRRFEDALRTAKTMFALARHTGKHPTLIGDLVAVALAYITIGHLDEMLQQAGCPNLYWALTNVPQPFIGLRAGLQADRLVLANEFGILNEKEPMTESELKKAVEKLQALVHLVRPIDKRPKTEEQTLQAWLDRHTKDKVEVLAARKRLVEFGLPERLVKDIPPVQVLLLDQKRAFEEKRDELAKVMPLPYWQAKPLLSARPVTRDTLGPLGQLGPMLAPMMAKVRQAQARLEQRFALLRHVEALRLYAAEHDGKLPKQLSDIKLPLPVDPVTGRSFRYTLAGNTATVEGGSLGSYLVRYVITIAK